MGSKKLTAKELATYEELQGTVLNQPEIPILREDAPYGRAYYQWEENFEDREFLPSPTTILNCLSKGIGFDKWLCSHTWESSREYANKRAWICTMTHILCSHLLWHKEVKISNGFYNEYENKVESIPLEVQKRLLGFLDFLNEYDPEPLGSEIMLYSNEKMTIDGQTIYTHPFAGTLDMLFFADLDGKGKKLIYCDLKTGAEHKKQHELQCTSYKLLFDHIYGAKYGEIDQMGCLYIKDTGKYKWKAYKFVPNAWYSVYETWKYLNVNAYGKLPKIKEKQEIPNVMQWKKPKKESNDE